MYKNIYLRRGKDSSLKRWHPWIFSGAIAQMDEDIKSGDCVRVINCEGQFVAVGHYQTGSIAVRVLAFDDIEINDDFILRRLQAAISVRQSLGLIRPDNSIYRLIHGEGDRMPALIIDIYNRTAVIQAHSVGMHLLRKQIAQCLHQLMADQLDCIYYKSDGTLPIHAQLEDESGYLYGHESTNVATEYGLKIRIDWRKGQKTGFFIDQRENRRLLEYYAKGRKVLNMFCYTGGFSVYAIRGGAVQVDSVDSSSRAIELTRDNVHLNFPDCTNHKAVAEDAFRYLHDIPEAAYNLIVLDPPAFAKHRDAIHNALKGYIRLNAAALSKIKSGGILFTFSCSQAITPEHFRQAVFTAATQAHRFVRILHQLHQPADHPINIYHPEGEYLKGLILYVE